jgi:hypothetical protein
MIGITGKLPWNLDTESLLSRCAGGSSIAALAFRAFSFGPIPSFCGARHGFGYAFVGGGAGAG